MSMCVTVTHTGGEILLASAGSLENYVRATVGGRYELKVSVYLHAV